MVTLERMYRKVLAIERLVTEQSALARLDLQSLRASMRPVIAHCERLLREKETLMKSQPPARPPPTLTLTPAADPVAWGESVMSNIRAMQARIGPPCVFEPLHAYGVRCAICGITP